MNNEQIKEKLLSLYEVETDFTVTMTGKISKKINGFYKPDTCEIFIHNKNFQDDNMMFYTAVHEFTHHIINSRFIKEGIKQRSGKVHDNEFWALFDSLISLSEEKGLYKRNRSEKLNSLIEEAKAIDNEIANLKKKLGKLIIEIQKTSKEEGVRYEDVLSHDIRIKKTTAEKCVKSTCISDEIKVGQDMQEALIKVNGKSQEIKDSALKAVENGNSVESVTNIILSSKKSESPKEKLEKEKIRIEKTISALNQRLNIVMEQLEVL